MSEPSLPPAAADSAAILRGGRRTLRIVVAVLVLGIILSIVRNVFENRALATATMQMQTPTVVVMSAGTGAPPAQIELPGTIAAFNEAPILARTTGYVRRWNADIGARVGAGSTLVDIDAPDLDQELAQARASAAQARASLDLAKKASARWQELRAADAVSQQEADDRAGALAELDAAAKAATANVARLEELTRFKSVTAPFAGVVLRRNVEIGQLVSAGSGSPLYVVQQIDPVRVFVSVSQADAAQVKVGSAATIEVAEYPGKPFTGSVTRIAGALDPTSRTRLTEIDVPNHEGLLLPGAYAKVKLDGARATRGVLIQNSALLFRAEGPRMAVVGDGGKVSLRPVTLGNDDGKQVEVLSGVAAGERVITNPPDAIRDGDVVKVAAK